MHGKQFQGNLVRTWTNEIRLAQGPNSNTLKYPKSLCHYCNTTLSQPYDRAFDRFREYTIANEQQLCAERIIDFQDIYGSDFDIQELHLFRYFAKQLGCKIDAIGLSVPRDLRYVFKKVHLLTRLAISFQIDENIRVSNMREWWLSSAAIVPSFARFRIPCFLWSQDFQWFRVHYSLGVKPEGKAGALWRADSRYLYLGRIQRSEEDFNSYIAERASLAQHAETVERLTQEKS